MDYPKSIAGVGLVNGKFVDENATTGQVGSLIPSAWGNAITDEVLALLAAVGLAPDETKLTQLRDGIGAIARGESAMNVVADTGAANAYVVTYAPAPAALVDGMVVWFKAKTANTGASTLNVNGLGVKALLGAAQSALQGGEVVPNGKCQAVWHVALNSWVLVSCTGGAQQFAAGAQSGHAVTLAQFISSMGASGYVKIPMMVGGVFRNLILQWGQATVGWGTVSGFTFPIAFPNAAYIGIPIVANSTAGYACSLAGITATGMNVFHNASVNQNVYWLALGW